MNRVVSAFNRYNREHIRTALIGAGVFALLAVIFLLSPWDGLDDWKTFYNAAERIFDPGTALYGTPTNGDYYYYNPPWFAVLLTPTTLFPPRTGWAVLSALTLVIALLLLRRWQQNPGYLKPILVLLSPSMIYMLLHGQIDLLVMAGLFLPAEWWGLVALTKPQTMIGLVALIPPRLWLRMALITGAILILSLIIFGMWPTAAMDQPRPFLEEGHNLWANLWPMQIPAGVLLVVLGYSRKDERLLIAGSPFLSPYAAMSSLIGPWIAAITFLKDWQAALVFASWWGAIILRGLG